MNVTAPLCPARHDSAYPVRTTRSCRSLTLFKTSASISEPRCLTARHDAARKNSSRSSRRFGGSTRKRRAAAVPRAAAPPFHPITITRERWSILVLSPGGPDYHRASLPRPPQCARPATAARTWRTIRFSARSATTRAYADQDSHLRRSGLSPWTRQASRPGRRNVDLAGSPALSRKTLFDRETQKQRRTVRSGNDLELMVG